MAFVCMGRFDGGDAPDPVTAGLSGRPMAACHPRGSEDLAAADMRRTFAFVTNTARGELAVVDMDRSRLLDMEPSAPGFNFIPVGVLPESIAASNDGCRLVTANRGSCDLSLVDPALAVGPDIVAEDPPGTSARPTGTVRQTVMPSGRSGPLRAAPHEIVFLPQETAELTEANHLCSADGAFDPAAPASRVPWRAIVTFPSCDLVAIVELPSGRITSSAYVRPEGIVLAGDDPVCPADCGPGANPAPTPPPVDASAPDDAAGSDGGAAAGDAGGDVSPPLAHPLRVGPLALVPDGSRVYVGAANAPFLTALDVSDGALAAPPGGGRIDLAEEPGGITRVRLSVDPYAGSDGRGRFLGGRGEFLYAIARDGSIRVIDVGRRVTGDFRERECDTVVDPLALGNRSPFAGCFAVDDPEKPVRRPLARGPGIRLPTSLPIDVAFASVALPDMTAMTETSIVGAYGFVVGANGRTYLVNIDPVIADGATTLPLTHTFRDATVLVSTQEPGPGRGPARVGKLPARTFVDPDLVLGRLDGPRVEGIATPSPLDNFLASEAMPVVTYAFFPDRSAVSFQEWTIGWEAALPEATRAAGKVRSPAAPGAPAVLEDEGANYCRSGVLPGDVLDMQGCDNDGGCGFGQTCVRSTLASGGIRGMCLGRDDVKALTVTCARHLVSIRRYQVTLSARRRLEVGMRLDERVRPSLAPCASDDDCRAADDPEYGGFVCRQVRDGEPSRCVEPCANPMTGMRDDALCRSGRVCEDVGAKADVGPLCVEGPPLDERCYSMFTPYRVQAGRAFVISGTGTPRFDTAREEGGQCVPNTAPSRHPLLVNRIPFDAPHCTNVMDGTASLDAVHTTPVPNPCLYRAPDADDPPPEGEPAAVHVKALFQNHQIRFVLTGLEELFGDDLQTTFEVHGGFVPTQVGARDQSRGDIDIALPARIVIGPTEVPLTDQDRKDGRGFRENPYLYLVDQGRRDATLERGQVFRINPIGPRYDDLQLTDPFLIE